MLNIFLPSLSILTSLWMACNCAYWFSSKTKERAYQRIIMDHNWCKWDNKLQPPSRSNTCSWELKMILEDEHIHFFSNVFKNRFLNVYDTIFLILLHMLRVGRSLILAIQFTPTSSIWCEWACQWHNPMVKQHYQ